MEIGGLKIFELVNNNWEEANNPKFTVIVGDKPVSKTLCFSPLDGVIYGLETKIDGGEDLIISGDLSKEWKSIKPNYIKANEMSDLVKFNVEVKEGSYRLSSFKILVKYLQGVHEDK